MSNANVSGRSRGVNTSSLGGKTGGGPGSFQTEIPAPPAAEVIDRFIPDLSWPEAVEGDFIVLNGSDLYDDTIDSLEISAHFDDNGVRSLSVVATISVNFRELTDGLDDEKSDEYLNAHFDAIESWLVENYGARVGGNDSWEDGGVEFVVSGADLDQPFPTDVDSVENLVTEKTQLTKLHNELNGAYGGSLYGFFGSLRAHLDELDGVDADEVADEAAIVTSEPAKPNRFCSVCNEAATTKVGYGVPVWGWNYACDTHAEAFGAGGKLL
jgi:hypothetical protein